MTKRRFILLVFEIIVLTIMLMSCGVNDSESGMSATVTNDAAVMEDAAVTEDAAVDEDEGRGDLIEDVGPCLSLIINSSASALKPPQVHHGY